MLVLRRILCLVCLLEDLRCEGEHFGDPTLQQSSLVRLNLMHLVRVNRWETHLFEPSSSIGNHMNSNLRFMSIIIIVGAAFDSATSKEQIERTCSSTNDVQEKLVLTDSIEIKDERTIVFAERRRLI